MPVPSLVYPSSRIVGAPAVFNVMMGRYKVLTGEFADLMLGYYGETSGRANQEGVHTHRAADFLKPEWDELRSEP